MEIAIAILIIIVCFLLYKLHKKQSIDNQKIKEYTEKKAKLQQEYHTLQTQIENSQNNLTDIENKYTVLLDQYSSKSAAIDSYIADLRARQEQQLAAAQHDKEISAQLKLEQLLRQYEEEVEAAKQETENFIAECQAEQEQIKKNTEEQAERYKSLLEPIKQYEKERQDKLFYTIQVPEEYHDDIDFLLNTVSLKVQHPDIISKLIWTEYIKPYMDETIKRVGIEDKPGIYKITNIENGKSYIGKSTNVKKRLQDHFKASVGLNSISWQAVHDEILHQGIWNWSIEIIIYCDKEQLSELEKYYIDFFKTQEWGYNKKQGG